MPISNNVNLTQQLNSAITKITPKISKGSSDSSAVTVDTYKQQVTYKKTELSSFKNYLEWGKDQLKEPTAPVESNFPDAGSYEAAKEQYAIDKQEYDELLQKINEKIAEVEQETARLDEILGQLEEAKSNEIGEDLVQKVSEAVNKTSDYGIILQQRTSKNASAQFHIDELYKKQSDLLADSAKLNSEIEEIQKLEVPEFKKYINDDGTIDVQKYKQDMTDYKAKQDRIVKIVEELEKNKKQADKLDAILDDLKQAAELDDFDETLKKHLLSLKDAPKVTGLGDIDPKSLDDEIKTQQITLQSKIDERAGLVVSLTDLNNKVSGLLDDYKADHDELPDFNEYFSEENGFDLDGYNTEVAEYNARQIQREKDIEDGLNKIIEQEARIKKLDEEIPAEDAKLQELIKLQDNVSDMQSFYNGLKSISSYSELESTIAASKYAADTKVEEVSSDDKTTTYKVSNEKNSGIAPVTVTFNKAQEEKDDPVAEEPTKLEEEPAPAAARSVSQNSASDYAGEWGFVKIKVSDFLDALEKGIVTPPTGSIYGLFIGKQHPLDDGTFKSVGYKINYDLSGVDAKNVKGENVRDGFSDEEIELIKKQDPNDYIYINLPYYSVQGALYDAIAADENAGVYPEESFKAGTYWGSDWDPKKEREKLLINPGKKDEDFIKKGGYPEGAPIPTSSSSSAGGSSGTGIVYTTVYDGDKITTSTSQGFTSYASSPSTSNLQTSYASSTNTTYQSSSGSYYADQWTITKIKASDLVALIEKGLVDYPIKALNGKSYHVSFFRSSDGLRIDDNIYGQDSSNNTREGDLSRMRAEGDSYIYINIPYSCIQGALYETIKNDKDNAGVYPEDQVKFDYNQNFNGIKYIKSLGTKDTFFIEQGGFAAVGNYTNSPSSSSLGSSFTSAASRGMTTLTSTAYTSTGTYSSTNTGWGTSNTSQMTDNAVSTYSTNIYSNKWAHIKIKASELLAAGFKNPITAPNGKKYYVGIYNANGLKIDDKLNNSAKDHALLESMGEEYVYINLPYSYIEGDLLEKIKDDPDSAVYPDEQVEYKYNGDKKSINFDKIGSPDKDIVKNGGYVSGKNIYSNKWAHIKIKASELLASGFKNPVTAPNGKQYYVGIYNADGLKIDDKNNSSSGDEALLKSMGEKYVYVNLPYSYIQNDLLEKIKDDPDSAVYPDEQVEYKYDGDKKSIDFDKIGSPDKDIVENGGYLSGFESAPESAVNEAVEEAKEATKAALSAASRANLSEPSATLNASKTTQTTVKLNAKSNVASTTNVTKNTTNSTKSGGAFVRIKANDLIEAGFDFKGGRSFYSERTGLRIDDDSSNPNPHTAAGDKARAAKEGDNYIYINLAYSELQGAILDVLKKDKHAAVYDEVEFKKKATTYNPKKDGIDVRHITNINNASPDPDYIFF